MFQPRFAGLVASGTKRQTMRGKARCKPGDELSFRRWKDKPYRSLQLPLCASAPCTAVKTVRIAYDATYGPHIHVGGDRLQNDDCRAFAQADGFKDVHDLLHWIETTHGLPFDGELIEW